MLLAPWDLHKVGSKVRNEALVEASERNVLLLCIHCQGTVRNPVL